MELRVDAAYRVTRDLSLESASNSSTSARASDAVSTRNNTQDVIMYGLTTGITYNR